jgi:hypothetical protein
MSQNAGDPDDSNNIGLKLKLFNFYYSVLRKKSFGMAVLIVFIIFEGIELISYAFNKLFKKIWKLDSDIFDLIELITGATRITALMKYLTFNAYLLIFCFISIFIFVNFLLLSMALSFGNGKPRLYNFCIVIQSYITSNVFFFFMVPTMELLLSVNKCDENGKIEIITKNDIYCYKGTHFILVFISVIITILQLILILLNSFFNFNPFGSNKATSIIDPSNNILLVLFKFILVLLYVLLNSEWIQIIVMLLGSFIVFKSTLSNPTYKSDILQCMLVIKSCIVFYTYLILMLGQLMASTGFTGLIYFLPIGYVLLTFMSILLYKYTQKNFVEAKTNFKNEDEFLNRINYFKLLIDDFIEQNRSRIKNNDYNNYKRKEIVIRGQIALHEENCLDEECPLKKFLENHGNFSVQRTSLMQYANILYVQAIKQFPDSQAIMLNFLKFNYENKYNLSTAKIYLEKIERFKNSIREDYIIFFIKKCQSTIINDEGEEIIINEEDTPQHKINRFKLLIDTSTKLFGEFWGNLATNLTHNLNLNKLFRVGNRINKYLKEMNNLWEELRDKKIDHEQQNILQLYSTFVKSILQNQAVSTIIENKIKDADNYQIYKENSEKVDINNLSKILERPVYQIYTRSNDMGKCHIIQCSNSIVHLLGYTKQELIGKRIEMLMPFICQSEHSDMLSDRLKKLRQLMLDNHNEDLKDRAKTTFILFPKTKAGYLYPINCIFEIFNDDDFANTFIIKTNFTIKDAKVNYYYYICTRSDFSIDSISSSSINLGFTLEILKKYVINMKDLIISTKGEILEFKECFRDFAEPKDVYFLGLDKVLHKNNKVEKKEEDEEKKYTEKELEKLHKIKMNLSIIEIKFRENEPLGYCFVLNEEKSLVDEKKNDDKINLINKNQLIHYDRNLLLYDVMKFNYVRTNVRDIEEEADEEVSGSVEPNQLKENSLNKSISSKKKVETLSSLRSNANNKKSKRKKESSSSSYSSSSSSSDENDEKKKKNPLTKESVAALKYKDAETLRFFIMNLPFYGHDVNLTRKSPNGSDFRVGYGFEPNIKISVAAHIKKIDKIYSVDKKNINKLKQKMFAKSHTLENSLFGDNKEEENIVNNKENEEIKGEENKPEEEKGNEGLDVNLDMNTNNHLKNLFSEASLHALKISSILYFLILLCLYIFEFMTSYNKFSDLKNYVNYSIIQYEILSSLMYCKYFLTEAVLAENDLYRIYDTKYNNDHKKYIEGMLEELRKYREIIYRCLGDFSEPEKIGKDFAEYTQNKSLFIRQLVAHEETNKTVPFWSGINQIPTSIFSIAKVENNITDINMQNRNVYDLMMNLINDYFVGWKDTTNLVITSITGNSKLNFLFIFIFIISFVFCFLCIIIFYQILSKFIEDGTRPVDLILTIKKSKFEELKAICENYMNTLMNKFLGEEVDKVDDDAAATKMLSSLEISDNDIVVSKFKRRNKYNHSVFSNQKFAKIYIGSVVSMIIFEIYFIVKFFNSKNSFKRIQLCVDVNNVTRNSEVDIVMSYNVIKSFFLDPKIPLLNDVNSEFILRERVKNITDAVEDWTKFTFLYMKDTGESYMNKFIDLFFKNITHINQGGFKDDDFLGSMKYGFRSFVSRYLSLMKTGSLMDLDNVNKTDILDNEELGENGLKIVYVIRPWFKQLNEELDNTLKDIFDKMIFLCICLYIGFFVDAIVVYALIWKNIEFQLEKYLTGSIELINLIPEKMKRDLVNKINEEKDFKELE